MEIISEVKTGIMKGIDQIMRDGLVGNNNMMTIIAVENMITADGMTVIIVAMDTMMI